MKKLAISFAIVAGAYGITAQAEPAKRDLPGAAEAVVISAQLKVEKIDRESRTVTLKREDGSLVEVKAGPEVRNFAQIETGDNVNIEYREGTSISVEPESVGAKIDTLVTEAKAALGEKPAAETGVRAEFRSVVDAIDYETRKVTLKGPGGKTETFTVSEDVKRFANVKKGDEVVVRMTESVSISVTKG